MKINLFLLLKVVTFELIYFFVTFLITVLILFEYFGSGAGSSRTAAIASGILDNYIIIFPPLLFNFYKIFKLYKNQFEKAMTYLIAEIVMIIFFVYMHFIEFIGT